MKGQMSVTALPTAAVSSASFGWIDGIARRMIRLAARHAPESLCERLEEEWLADLSERPGRMSRLRLACGCFWAAAVITHDHCAVTVPATISPVGDETMASYVNRGAALFSRRSTSAAPGAVMCDMNITPLIDVMLVLLITLIVSLPIMTHAVKLDLPQAPPSPPATPPEVINLDIDFDGTIVWNGKVLAGLQQLESYLRIEAQKDPQSEIHLRPDAHVKYDFVAKVLASAQRNRMTRMGFVNTGDFKD
jgi:biopolymer transport protein ExbD